MRMQPVLKPLLVHDCYILIEKYITSIKIKNKTWSVKIPCNFITDGASIPKTLWTVAGSPYQPKFIAAAVLHDWMYRHHNLNLNTGRMLPVTRKEADQIYRNILKKNGVNRWLRNKHYYALRMFGMFAWK